jgi:signal transduction histidine kinase/DNA-binding response OmpR family regulator/HPt (histidine-containing phosphotransfer) domain-containing protein
MMGLPRLLSNTGFRHQLVLTFTAGIVCLTLISSMVTSTLSSRSVQTNIIEQGRQATRSFAQQSTLALLYQSADNARDAVETTLAFPDVHALAIYDLEHNLLLAEGNKALIAGTLEQWPETLELAGETEKFWHFVAPVHTRSSDLDEVMFPYEEHADKPQLLGHVLVVIGKDTLTAMTNDILQTTFLVSGILATALLLLLLGITSRVTTPIKNLADIMRRAELGEKNLRAEVRGPRDIIHMETAFNTMMGVQESREKELEKARDTAIEAARIKGEFAANVSHELRTPLNGILGMLELLLSMDLSPKQHEYAKIAHNSGESLLELIDDVLDFSRVKAGKLKAKPVDFYPHEIMDEVIGLLSGQAERKNLVLNYHIDENTPTALRGEAGFIRQLLLNLAGNAVKYTEHGSIRLSAHSIETDRGLQLHFEIRDSGIGIPKAAQGTIFEAFSQVDTSTTRKFGGTGLGLAICRQLVELLAGEIGVESELGKGSTFWFTAPIEIAKGLPTKTRQRTNELSALRILVVESEDAEQELLRHTLDNYEIRCTHAADGAQALAELQYAAAEKHPYDITIVDERLSDMKGIELLRRILNDPPISSTKVIIATSRTFGRNEAQLAGIAGCLIKPIEDTALLNVISEVVNDTRSDMASDDPGKVNLSSTAGLLGLRILVAEDNHANQTVAVGMLDRLGCRPAVVFNGTEAVASVNSGNFDLVLMDCHMPEMDGYQATTHIRKLGNANAQIPIIAMTANTRPGDDEKCLEAGMNDYLPKPLKLKILREKLLQWFPAAPIPLCSTKPLEPTAIDESTSAILDHEVLSELHYSIGQSIVQVIQAFLEDMPIYLDSLEKGINANDPQLMAEFAHTIKGSSRNLGATRLAGISMALEDLGRAGSLNGAMELAHQLGEAWNQVREALEQEQNLEIDFELEEQAQQKTWHPRILVVDDDRGMRFALRNVLEEDGYDVDEATLSCWMPSCPTWTASMPANAFNACPRAKTPQYSSSPHWMTNNPSTAPSPQGPLTTSPNRSTLRYCANAWPGSCMPARRKNRSGAWPTTTPSPALPTAPISMAG